MRSRSSFALVVAVCALVGIAAAPAALAQDDAAPDAVPDAAAVTDDVAVAGVSGTVVDEGVLLDAASSMLALATEPARIAVVVVDADDARRTAVERSLVRALRDRRREDIVTPALVKARLGDSAVAQLEGGPGAVAVAADHVIIAEVQNSADGVELAMRLVNSASAAVVSTVRVPMNAAPSASSARVQDLRVAAADVSDLIAEIVERQGLEPRTHRIAVPQAQAEGAAKEARVDQLIQTELNSALRDRGFLVVERTQLASAMDQLALAQLTDAAAAKDVGKVVGAQSMALAAVVEAADTFIVTVRVVDVEGGTVMGAAKATIKRDNVVALAAVETRSVGEAVSRSAMAPGWGQAYNGSSSKALVFGVGTYGALAATAGLGIGAGVSYSSYLGTSDKDSTPAEASRLAVERRETTNVLLAATALSGAVTALLWGLNVADAWIDASSN
jgi:hypothetical protein